MNKINNRTIANQLLLYILAVYTDIVNKHFVYESEWISVLLKTSTVLHFTVHVSRGVVGLPCENWTGTCLVPIFFIKSLTNASKEGPDFITGKCRQSLNGMFVRNTNVTSMRTAKDKTWYFVNYGVNY
jgi:hypothetical protein